MTNIVKISTSELFKKYNKEKLLFLIKEFENKQDGYFQDYKNNLYEKNKTVSKKTFWGGVSEYTVSRENFFIDLDVTFELNCMSDKYKKIRNTYHRLYDSISNINDVDLVPEIILESYDYNLLFDVLNIYNKGESNDSV